MDLIEACQCVDWCRLQILAEGWQNATNKPGCSCLVGSHVHGQCRAALRHVFIDGQANRRRK